jgi:PAS domain S-box-containing protein
MIRPKRVDARLAKAQGPAPPGHPGAKTAEETDGGGYRPGRLRPGPAMRAAPMFRTLRNFTITGVVAIATLIVVLATYVRHESSQLMETGEGQNVAFTQVFVNALWPRFASYVNSVPDLDGDALRARLETAEIQVAAVALMRGMPVQKVKIYNLEGLTVYSSVRGEIGEDQSGNPAFVAARAGKVISNLSQRRRFDTSERDETQGVFLESYVPIRRGSGPVEAVFESYLDVTPMLAKTEQVKDNLLVGFALLVGAFFGILFLIARRADRVLKQQYGDLLTNQENLKIKNRELEHEIGERKRTEERLQQKTSLVRLLRALAATANAASRPEDAMCAFLDEVCAYMGWPVGHVYMPAEESPDLLASSGIWHLDEPERFATFRQVTESTPIPRTHGLLGRVMASGRHAWIADLTAEVDFHRARAASDIGLRAAFALPVLVGDDVVAVLEFFSDEVVEPDQSLLRVMGHVGTELGQVVKRSRAEKDVRKLSRAVEQSPVSVIVTDTAGNIEYVNPKFVAVTGYTPEEVIGKNPRVLKSGHTSAEDYRELWAHVSSGREWRGQLHNKKKNGELFWESSLISPIRDANGRITNYLAVNEDITERKKIELELRESREYLEAQNHKLEETMVSLVQAREKAEAASQAKSGFLANMSHELRTPLNAVIGFTELMESEVHGPVGHPRYREYLGIIREAGQHLLALITDILDISRIEAGKLELNESEVSVVGVIEESLLWIEKDAAKNGCRLSTRIMNSLPSLYADKRKLRQMLINLLSNAVKFTPAGGEIILRAEVDSDGGFALSVADTGIGITPENIQMALVAFGQVETALSRSHDGAGLGLPLAKALVELHGGTLEIDSEIGVGTTVTLRFPAERVVRAHGLREDANASQGEDLAAS